LDFIILAKYVNDSIEIFLMRDIISEANGSETVSSFSGNPLIAWGFPHGEEE
jgi:hypothetical protein